MLELNAEIAELDEVLAPLVTTTAPALVARVGVGVDTAGALLVAAGENTGRLRNERSFARLCGAAPLDASSNKQTRHRLSRAGDRQANSALWRIINTRLSYDPTTKRYMQRRRVHRAHLVPLVRRRNRQRNAVTGLTPAVRFVRSADPDTPDRRGTLSEGGRMNGQWKPRHVITLAAVIAAAVALMPVAVGAATGSLVNIADPAVATQIAKVDPSGALRTAAKALPPTTPFEGRGTVYNFYTSGAYYVLSQPSAASVVISRVAYTNAITNDDAWEVFLYISQGNTESECLSNLFGIYRQLEHVNVPAMQTVMSPQPDSTRVLKPLTPGGKWCLVAGAGPTQNLSSADFGGVTVDYSGYTAAGTFVPSSAPAGATPSPAGTGLNGGAAPGQ